MLIDELIDESGDRSPDSFDVQLIPMINIVFLLLLFFMVSGYAMLQSHLPLVPVVSEQTSEQLLQVEVVVDQHGNLSLNGQPADLADLAALNNAEIALVLDQQVPFVLVDPVMQALAQQPAVWLYSQAK
ncbi:ExbD/TolR family protein [Salinibius halmophilus]|uniref:ExbD/TolR family protein n=1 Tax=Salinibius halmophilus TaxID=1853216 RepID=UPI000E662BD0|nr:biopolymer transporter ExbD [Salinibius halmophilus]